MPRTGLFLHGLVGLAMVVAGVPGPAGGDATVSAQAVNPCALITVEEIQPLAANESIADGVQSSLQTLGTSICRYSWGAGVGRFKLDVIVNEAPRLFPGMSPDQIKQRLQESLKEGTTDAVIPDVGEAAVFRAESPSWPLQPHPPKAAFSACSSTD